LEIANYNCEKPVHTFLAVKWILHCEVSRAQLDPSSCSRPDLRRAAREAGSDGGRRLGRRDPATATTTAEEHDGGGRGGARPMGSVGFFFLIFYLFN